MRLRERLYPIFFLIPFFIIVIIFWIFPFIYEVYLSFLNIDLNRPYEEIKFSGLENYFKIFKDPNFGSVVYVSIMYTLLFTIGQILAGMSVALILKRIANRFVRSILISPFAISTTVVSLLFLWMLQPEYGIVSYFWYLLTGSRLQWMRNGTLALLVTIIGYTWKYFPLKALIFLAALESVPISLYEAAKVDGATSIQTFFNITLPSIKPTFLIVVLLSIIQGSHCFDIIYIMTSGGPAMATTNYVIYLYQTMFEYHKVSYASALSVILLIIEMALAISYLKILKVVKK
jgi:sn-glycerol 3-phosphate transport system permease protein